MKGRKSIKYEKIIPHQIKLLVIVLQGDVLSLFPTINWYLHLQ